MRSLTRAAEPGRLSFLCLRGLPLAVGLSVGSGGCKQAPNQTECETLNERMDAIFDKETTLRESTAHDTPEQRAAAKNASREDFVKDCTTTYSRASYECMMRSTTGAQFRACVTKH